LGIFGGGLSECWKARLKCGQDMIKIDANENPYGCSPRVNKALATYPQFNIYPETDRKSCGGLSPVNAGTDIKHIVCGNGSNQLIDC